MEKVTGKIERVSQKDKRYGIMIDQTWYNGFGKAPANKDQTIEFEFEKSNTGFNDIKKIIKVMGPSEEPQSSGEIIGESAKKKRCSEMMRCAVDICLARNTYEDENIMGQFKRFMKAIGEEIPEQEKPVPTKEPIKPGDPKLVSAIQNL